MHTSHFKLLNSHATIRKTVRMLIILFFSNFQSKASIESFSDCQIDSAADFADELCLIQLVEYMPFRVNDHELQINIQNDIYSIVNFVL